MNPCISAVQHLRKLRGGSQSHLLLASDGANWVTKFVNNPQHVRVLANEMLATSLGQLLSLPMPRVERISASRTQGVSMSLKIRFRFDGRCSVHSRYNPEIDCRPQHENCAGCKSLYVISLYTAIAREKADIGDGLVVRHAVQREEECAVGAAEPLMSSDPAE